MGGAAVPPQFDPLCPGSNGGSIATFNSSGAGEIQAGGAIAGGAFILAAGESIAIHGNAADNCSISADGQTADASGNAAGAGGGSGGTISLESPSVTLGSACGVHATAGRWFRQRQHRWSRRWAGTSRQRRRCNERRRRRRGGGIHPPAHRELSVVLPGILADPELRDAMSRRDRASRTLRRCRSKRPGTPEREMLEERLAAVAARSPSSAIARARVAGEGGHARGRRVVAGADARAAVGRRRSVAPLPTRGRR